MSSTHLSIYAYDVMDRVQFTVRIGRLPDDADSHVSWSTMVSDAIPSTGETDPHEWLRDVLVAILEAT